LLGIVKKTAGDAWMLGQPAGQIEGRRKVGYLPEHHRIPRHLTGNTALEYYGQLSGMSLADVKQRRPELLELVGLEHRAKDSITGYSKGMQQRLGLAQAMLHDPELLILDEPTDGVDPKGRAKIREVLQRLQAEGRTIFINSHLLQELELICDRVAAMHLGRVAQVGKLSELTEETEPQMTFMTNADIATARSALAKFLDISFVDDESREVAFTCSPHDQAFIDSITDALRENGISIISMTRRRRTLEQVFLELVNDESRQLS